MVKVIVKCMSLLNKTLQVNQRQLCVKYRVIIFSSVEWSLWSYMLFNVVSFLRWMKVYFRSSPFYQSKLQNVNVSKNKTNLVFYHI